jgi:midasin, putative
MNGYQLYLENIINALARVGIHYPLKLESYEDLFYTSESLGSFLEINSFLQRVGEGYSIAGLDESVTYRSYWYSEFYLEFQERVLTTDSYKALESEEESVEDVEDLESTEDVKEEQTNSEEKDVASIVSPFGKYSSIVGTTLDGFDSYGVPFDVEEEDDGSETKEENTDREKEDVSNYSGLTGTNSDGLDVYGVDLEEVPDEDVSNEKDSEEKDSEEVVDEVSEPTEFVSTDFDFPEENVEDIVSTVEVPTSETVSSDGFDLYGVELEDFDEENSEDYNEEDDPNNPESGVVVDLVGDEPEGYDEEFEEYDEENDPDNPDNGSYADLATPSFEEYDEENDPDNPDNGNYQVLVGEGYEENFEEYDKENDPDNPDNGNYQDLVSSSYDDEDEDYENDPDNPENSIYRDVVESSSTQGYVESPQQTQVAPNPPQAKPKQVKSPVNKNMESTQNMLNFLGRFEKTILGKVKKNGKN